MQSHSALSEYNPIKHISLHGADLPSPEGIVVIVGPNSSGKTLFLKDIERFLLTGSAEFVVCKSVVVRKPPDSEAMIHELYERRYIREKPDNSNVYESWIPYLGSILARPPQGIRPSFPKASLRPSCENIETDPKSAASFFPAIGQALVAPLSLEDRRRVCDKVSSFDHQKGCPDYPLQGLQVNSPAQTVIAEETGRIFGNTAWLDISEKGCLQLRVSGTPHLPPVGDMLNPFEAEKYRTIESEGDGYRAYVGICLSLLIGIRPVNLIDEPELCLHPLQAYTMGRFIGQFTRPNDHLTFVATHSSHVLRGILAAASDTKITVIRMSHKQGAFWSRKLSEESLLNCIHNPRTREESILDGVFSRGVVLVESEGDREVYHAAAESIIDYASREVQFIPVGGTGGFANPARFYRRLEIPVGVVADLDAICDTSKMIACTEALCLESEDASAISEAFTDLAGRLKALPPSITAEEVKEALREIGNREMDWKRGDDNALRRELNELEGRIKRLHRLKEGGIDGYDQYPDIKTFLVNLVQRCKGIGLFFVPRGELEDWVPHLMSDCPKRNKIERAAIAASRIRAADVKEGDVWEFVESVFNFLDEKNT
jgi:hypothetical protein